MEGCGLDCGAYSAEPCNSAFYDFPTPVAAPNPRHGIKNRINEIRRGLSRSCRSEVGR